MARVRILAGSAAPDSQNIRRIEHFTQRTRLAGVGHEQDLVVPNHTNRFNMLIGL